VYRFVASDEIDINSISIALLNYLCATKAKERFLIRLNGTKNKEETQDELLEILSLFGIQYDALYYKSQNRKFYHQCAAQLLSSAKAFSCFCTQEQLSSNQNGQYDGRCERLSDEEVLNNESPFTIRIKKPKEPISFTDLIKGEFTYRPQDIDSFVILHQDKTPTNDFATAVDDMLQGVSFVIQNEKELPSIPKQNHIRQSLGYSEKITFASLKSITSEDAQIYQIKWLLNEGFLPQAILNYLLLIYTKAPSKIFTLKEALKWFDFSLIKETPEQFDLEKLRLINAEHLRHLDSTKLGALLDFSGEDFGKIAKLYVDKFPTLKELKPQIHAVFEPKNSIDSLDKEFELLKNSIKNAPFFDDFKEFKTYLQINTKLNEQVFDKLLYKLLTGSQDGPKLEEIYPLIKNYLKEIIR